MAIITPALLKALFTGYEAIFDKVFKETPSDYSRIC